jgi:Arc/MetJ family transcription regulator
MTRTNIEIDDELVARAMARYGLATKRAAVELALVRLVGPPLSGAALADFLDGVSGSGWVGDEAASDDVVTEI